MVLGEEKEPKISGELRTSGDGSYEFSGSIWRQLALIVSSKFTLTMDLRDESDGHCRSCCRSGKLAARLCDGFCCGWKLMIKGSCSGLETGMPVFDSAFLMASFSCLTTLASISVVDIISRKSITSCSRCLT